MSSPFPPPSPIAPPAQAFRPTTHQAIAMASGAAVVVGSFLPWAKALGFITFSGTDGDGMITLIAGAMALAGLFVRKRSLQIWVAVLFVVTAAIALYDYFSLQNKIDSGEDMPFDGAVSIGVGLYMVMVGGVLGTIMTLIHRKEMPPA